uniref:Nuclear receptor subfamily 1 group H member 2 n=1 Tax=Macaca fascicularis TaxID=9541 RepID=A0A7N9CHN2_MACFA
MSQALMRPAQPAAWTGSSQILKRSQSASERRAQPRRCWATSFAASAGTRPPASTTMCLAAKAARASSGAVWSVAGPGAMPAGAVEPARWTLSCGASASSAGCASARRQGGSSASSLKNRSGRRRFGSSSSSSHSHSRSRLRGRRAAAAQPLGLGHPLVDLRQAARAPGKARVSS